MLATNENPVKAKIKAGGKVSATWLSSGSPIITEVIAQAGFDVGVIDMEHGLTEIMSLAVQMQAMKNTAMVPFVRPPWNDFVLIKRILDAGAYGLIVPYVNNREEAEKAVAAALYPPDGIRGLATGTRAGHYNNAGDTYLTSKSYRESINKEVFIFTQVETPESLATLDEVLKIERLDGVFIGPMDLSTNMGYFANPNVPEVQKAIAEVEKKVLAAGKGLATIGGDWEDTVAKYRRGYHMVINMSDTSAIGQAAREKVGQFRKEFGK